MKLARFMIVVGIITCLAVPVLADPVQVTTFQLTNQDDWTLEGWVEELSTAPHSQEQLISSQDVTWEGHIPCPVEYGGQGAVQVEITNLTTRYFPDLYYVADVLPDGGPLTTLTNFDEMVGDVSTGPAQSGLAFKIDSIGLNTPLVFESMTQDDVFEPGEIWQFIIQEYANTLGLPPSALGSVGAPPLGAIAAASAGDSVSSGSVITPEPATLSLLVMGGLGLLRRRRK